MLIPDVYDNRTIYRYKAKPTSKIYVGSFELRNCGDRYEIWCLGIDGRYRNNGYGTKMLTEFLATFHHDKPLILYVHKENAVAIHLYEKVGFAICEKWPFSKCIWTMKYHERNRNHSC